MALHTKDGDGGFTDLPDRRVRKDAPLPAALGALDELNATVGRCLAEANRINHVFIREALLPVQGELLAAGADLAAAGGQPRLDPAAVERMERDVDSIRADLPELKHFILPAGGELACRLHLARAVARRAERDVVAALDPQPGAAPPAVLRYLNRLSDLLFALARLANRDADEPDAIWTP